VIGEKTPLISLLFFSPPELYTELLSKLEEILSN